MADKSRLWQAYGKRTSILDIVSLIFLILVLISLLSTFLEYLEHPNWMRGIIIIITIITIYRVRYWVKELDRRSEKRKTTLWDAFWAVKAAKAQVNLLIELQEKPQHNADDIKMMEALPHQASNTLAATEAAIEKNEGW